MTSLLPAVTTAALVPGTVSIDSKTITMWLQLSVGAGVYQTGGIPAGIKALASSLGLDVNQYLNSFVQSELQVPSSGSAYQYRYIPSLDYLQIFTQSASAGTVIELSSSAIIPAGVISDVIVGEFVYNRI